MYVNAKWLNNHQEYYLPVMMADLRNNVTKDWISKRDKRQITWELNWGNIDIIACVLLANIGPNLCISKLLRNHIFSISQSHFAIARIFLNLLPLKTK